VQGIGGDFSAFWPSGIRDAPWTVVVAINHAIMVISWHENLPRDEQPPREIWWSGELLDEWFRNVEENRSSKSSTRSSSYKDADDVPMTENVYAEGMRPHD
jgi:hypothetical protein